MAEWSILSLAVLVLLWFLGRQLQEVQAQSERVVVWSTLAQLRAALMLEQLSHHIRPNEKAATEKNPFRLLQTLPPTFAGDVAMRDAEAVPPGSWMHDPACGCVGYRLLHPQWLEPPQMADTVWFRITVSTGEAHLIPYAPYRWFDQPL